MPSMPVQGKFNGVITPVIPFSRALPYLKTLSFLKVPAQPDPTAQEEAPPSPVAFDSGYNPPPEVRRNRQKLAAENESEGLVAAGFTVGGIGLLIGIGGAGTLLGVSNTAGQAGGGTALGVGLAMMVAGGVLLGVGYKKKKAIASARISNGNVSLTVR